MLGVAKNMGFSQEIRIRALTASARHCCVCNRYKGVRVEVHHIIPEDKGGKNDFDNAIVLCFDCHTDAGHYNPKHPKGSKFSPFELRAHRDRWYESVRRNSIISPATEDLLYCYFLVCKHLEAAIEITEANLSKMPIEYPLLTQNNVLRFQKRLLNQYTDRFRATTVSSGTFATKKELLEAYPDSESVEKEDPHLYPYFETFRVPTVEELKNKVAREDPITASLLREGVSPTEISRAVGYEELCGDSGFEEIYLLRPFWTVYLVATNITGAPLKLKDLNGPEVNPSGFQYRGFESLCSRPHSSLPFPKAAVLNGQSVVIPIATVLGPLQGDFEEIVWSSSDQYFSRGEGQTLKHCDNSSAVPRIKLIGPSIYPRSITATEAGRELTQDIHELDFSNLYVLSRFWEMGSCPHVFFRRSRTRKILYVGELYGRAPNLVQTNRLIVPSGVDAVIIAELEREETHVIHARVNGVTVCSNCHLAQGDELILHVREGDSVTLTGSYRLITQSPSVRSDPYLRNEVVSGYMINAT